MTYARKVLGGASLLLQELRSTGNHSDVQSSGGDLSVHGDAATCKGKGSAAAIFMLVLTFLVVA
jgi:hypothetical protein